MISEERLRDATEAELLASREAAERDGGVGAIRVAELGTCWVEE